MKIGFIQILFRVGDLLFFVAIVGESYDDVR